MFCKNCGAAMPDDAFFCPVCGQDSRLPVNQTQSADQNASRDSVQAPYPYAAPGYRQGLPPVQQPMPPQMSPQMPIQRKNRNTGLIIILAAAIVLIAAAIIILAVLVFGKAPDIEGTWEGRVTLEMDKDDSGLEEDFADLLDRSSNAVIIFDMDDSKTGTAEIYFDDYPTDEIELDVKLSGKKISLTGELLGYDTKLSGKIDQKDDKMSFFAKGSTTGRKGSMSAELDFDQESDKKIRPTTQETTYETTESEDNTAETTDEGVADTTPPVTDTEPPVETTTTATTPEVTVTVPTESLVDDPDLVLADFLLGDWVSNLYPDGTASIMVFYDYENVTWYISYPGESTDDPVEGYMNNTWGIDYVSDGIYYIENNQLYISWLDMDGIGDIYDVAIVDENTIDMTLYFEDGESFTDRYQRVIW